ncbi:MAG: carbohydrate kinase family protein [Butyrivibrio sp.]|nr:carbohydrate kinase family protein [Butyrivibrio sp.]
MSKIVIAGITQFETVIKVDSIPFDMNRMIHDSPIYVGGGGDAMNEAFALTTLGDQVYFMSVVGQDQNVEVFNPPDFKVHINTDYILPVMKSTPSEIIFFDNDQHQLIFQDLKDIRQAKYDMSMVRPIMAEADLLLVSNANFCRPFIHYALSAGKKIALNMRSYSKEKEKYNADFLENADIIYISDDTVEGDPYEFIDDFAKRYDPEIIILGQGKTGLILYDRDRHVKFHYNSVKTNEVVNSLGAGNALISGFIHYYLETKDSVNAIKNGLLYASYKTGFMRTCEGFLTPEQVEQWRDLIWKTQSVTDMYGVEVPEN